mmetsp:Transcript_121570/g.344490  ORF Transcript_121570/g.344490 Transcript_121570/m.344490 type:complete len:204 (+) Transcript_121570:632-1243(+)
MQGTRQAPEALRLHVLDQLVHFRNRGAGRGVHRPGLRRARVHRRGPPAGPGLGLAPPVLADGPGARGLLGRRPVLHLLHDRPVRPPEGHRGDDDPEDPLRAPVRVRQQPPGRANGVARDPGRRPWHLWRAGPEGGRRRSPTDKGRGAHERATTSGATGTAAGRYPDGGAGMTCPPPPAPLPSPPRAQQGGRSGHFSRPQPNVP